ncbi:MULTISPECIES: DUF4199 domain-containing protein [Gammaproteobacteria]|uniref:DUF4199 domain-containing protein n=1 Tax=Gammaproteobacteria TaxID=1236 RepID=UPI000DCF85CA|nr:MULTISPECIES: DUF4199 domain-containing protein [Gammaproteobacteria]RTE86920.1 DUF4199 domain-containing protein [Aliidiomarina sp. B3213]TCZ93290.1 DUF4199 domain-containing protein [Lysobacter sp. N42]
MKQYQQEIKWGVIFSIAMLVWMVIERVAGLHDDMIDKHVIYTNGFAIVAIAVYVFALRSIRNNRPAPYTYKEAFISGVIISLVVAVLSPLTQWITHTFITPNFFDNMIAYTVSSGQATLEEAQAYFNFSSYVLQSVIFAFVMGVITTAIVAIFIRQKPH